MSVVGAQKKEYDRNAKQKLLGRRILCPIVDLLPHVQVVVSTTVEIKRHTTNPMEHDVGSEHVTNVG